MKTQYNYIPQKDSERFWIIKDIHNGKGFGVYTNKSLKPDQIVGDTHYIVDGVAIAITELGKFHNHSDKPNCEAIIGIHIIEIVALSNIKVGEELTVNYQDYEMILNIEKPNNWKKGE